MIIERRADLDFLRVAAILLLHLYHCGRFFNADDPWHLKAPQLLPVLNQPMDILHILRMPLLMLIAGAVAAYAIERRGLPGFAWDRMKRLLLPLLFGMLVVVPPQIYLEYLDRGRISGSYWGFWTSVFQLVPYPKGSLSWHHLWFVAYLFVYCLLALPIFAWLDRPSGRAFLRRTEAFLARNWNLLWLVVPILAIRIFLRHRPETNDLLHDPKGFLFYGYLFLTGHLLARCSAVWARLVTLRWTFLGLGLLLLAILLPDGEFPFPLEHVAVWLFSWTTLLAILGFARRGIRQEGPRLRHAQSLAYPFYILHQTVILAVGYPLMRPAMNPWARLGWVTLLSFLATWALCEGLSRVPWLRPLFGMGPVHRAAPAGSALPQPSEV
ncbi:acyltransferase family protein [Geothrix edaphica]|uniref:Membrane protein n=1 Tax=Geothrix edaphica TaxID=2927976 RepID=A0ABQ5PVZ0_9BACT|nr:acyltransferase family protein [Geothrix edaphica]GLH66334.1 membrane protein [Geothrix edaphica]